MPISSWNSQYKIYLTEIEKKSITNCYLSGPTRSNGKFMCTVSASALLNKIGATYTNVIIEITIKTRDM